MRPQNDNDTGLPLSEPVRDKTAGAADSGLAAAVRNTLGSGHEASHLPGRLLKTGQDIARRARAEKPSFRNATPRMGHIGPRSGHK